MLDILITSSSRPRCFKRTVESFIDKAEYSGKFRFLVHEDCVFPVMSRKVKAWLNEFVKYDDRQVIYCEDDPPIGLGNAIMKMLPKIQGELFFYSQDDWEFERTIPLDDMIGVMRHNISFQDINQLILSGYRLFDTERMVKGEKVKIRFPERRVDFPDSDRTFLIRRNWRWGMGIGLWKTRWAKTLPLKDNKVSDLSHDLRVKHNTYLWGPKEDWRYVMHLGGFLKMNRLENGLPGVGNASDAGARKLDDIHKAPWVEPRPRPTREEWLEDYRLEMSKIDGAWDGRPDHSIQ